MLDQQAIQVKAPYFAYEAGGRRITIEWDEAVGDVYVLALDAVLAKLRDWG